MPGFAVAAVPRWQSTHIFDEAHRPISSGELGQVMQPAPMARPLLNSCQAFAKYTVPSNSGEPEGSCI